MTFYQLVLSDAGYVLRPYIIIHSNMIEIHKFGGTG
jgi:hypothetical protein